MPPPPNNITRDDILSMSPSIPVGEQLPPTPNPVYDPRYPYYKAHFAMELKAVVDKMLATGLEQEFRFDTFKRAASTLNNRLSQSFRFLVDYLDDEVHTYARARANTVLVRKPTGIRMRFKDKLKTIKATDLIAVAVQDNETDAEGVPLWRAELDAFLASPYNGADTAVLHTKKLSLTPDEQNEIAVTLTTLGDDYLSRVTPTEIKVIKLNPDRPREGMEPV